MGMNYYRLKASCAGDRSAEFQESSNPDAAYWANEYATDVTQRNNTIDSLTAANAALTAQIETLRGERDALIYFMVDGLGYSATMVREQMTHIASLDIDLARLTAAPPPTTTDGGDDAR